MAKKPIRIDDDLYEELEKLAKEDERTITRYTNRLLRQVLEFTKKGSMPEGQRKSRPLPDVIPPKPMPGVDSSGKTIPVEKSQGSELSDVFNTAPNGAPAPISEQPLEPELFNVVVAATGMIVKSNLTQYEAQGYLDKHNADGDLITLPVPTPPRRG